MTERPVCGIAIAKPGHEGRQADTVEAGRHKG